MSKVLKKKVLVCDDDAMIREITELVLRAKGYEVKTIDNCNNLLDFVVDYKPDIILMDLMIPPTGGKETIELLRNHDTTKNIAILIFSANADLENISKELKVGFIKKPFDLKTFEARIEDELNKITE